MGSYCRRSMGYTPSAVWRRASARKKTIKAVFFQIIRTAFWGAIILCATLLVNRLIGYIGQTSYLAAQDIEFEGCQKVSPQELMAMTEITSGTNLLSVRPKEISSKLKGNPWIKDVTIERIFPHGLNIKVNERQPAALVADKSLFLLDADGVVFKEVERCDPVDFPVITGFSLGVDDTGLLDQVLELFRRGDSIGVLSRDSISEVHIDDEVGFTLYTLHDAVRIQLGFNDCEEKLKLLAHIQKDLQGRNITPGTIQLLSGEEAHVTRGSSS